MRVNKLTKFENSFQLGSITQGVNSLAVKKSIFEFAGIFRTIGEIVCSKSALPPQTPHSSFIIPLFGTSSQLNIRNNESRIYMDLVGFI